MTTMCAVSKAALILKNFEIFYEIHTPAQAETLLHSLEWAAAGIGLHVNAHITLCVSKLVHADFFLFLF